MDRKIELLNFRIEISTGLYESYRPFSGHICLGLARPRKNNVLTLKFGTLASKAVAALLTSSRLRHMLIMLIILLRVSVSVHIRVVD